MAIHRIVPAQQLEGLLATYTLSGIPEGVEGVRATLGVMRSMAREYKTNPRVLSTARSIVASMPGKDYVREAAALQNWVRSNIRYTQDVYNVETLQTPAATLALRHGDCDDQSVLLAALLNAIGHPARFVAVSFAPDLFEHVYVEAKINGAWAPVETTEPVAFGETPWAAEEVVSSMIVEA